ncbi:MAG: hypothetical protein PHY62_00240 [Gallionella sp.]|nr:hypothetical protein [Gallionella sp.]
MLGIEGQTVIFNVYRNVVGDDTIGIKEVWEVHDLCIPPTLEPLRDEIKQLLREGLEEMAFFRPLADGGTFEKPNTVARGNLLSFSVEFK